MSHKNALLIAVGGLPSTGNETIFQGLGSALRDKYPDRKIQLLRGPLDYYPPPFMLCDAERLEPAESKIDRYWDIGGTYAVEAILPAVRENDIVIIKSFGLAILTRATAYNHGETDFEKTFDIHHHEKVPGIVVKNGLKPPHYVIPTTPCLEEGIEQVIDYMVKKRPQQLVHISKVELRNYLLHQVKVCERYFDGTNQNPPIYLDARTSHDEMLDQALAQLTPIIREHLALSREQVFA